MTCQQSRASQPTHLQARAPPRSSSESRWQRPYPYCAFYWQHRKLKSRLYRQVGTLTSNSFLLKGGGHIRESDAVLGHGDDNDFLFFFVGV